MEKMESDTHVMSLKITPPTGREGVSECTPERFKNKPNVNKDSASGC
jgi:hypothetical protein